MKIDVNFKGCGIYCIENMINNKKYVGSSKNVYQRLHKHRNQLMHSKHDNSYLQASVDKYGLDNFECYVLEESTIENMFIREQEYIDSGNYIYNLNKKANGMILSEESRKKISESLKRGYRENLIYPTKTRKISVFDKEGCLIGHFNSIIECSKSINISANQIRKVLSHEQYHTHTYRFLYFDGTEKISKLNLDKNGYCIDKKPNPKLEKICYIYDTITNTHYEFRNIRKAVLFLDVNKNTLYSHIKISKNLFRNRYKITTARIKSDKLLENQEIDNQQPI